MVRAVAVEVDRDIRDNKLVAGEAGKDNPLGPARRYPIIAGTAALLPTAGAVLALLFAATHARAEDSPGKCDGAAEFAFLPSPVAPWKGAPLRVIVAAEKPIDGELSLIAPDE